MMTEIKDAMGLQGYGAAVQIDVVTMSGTIFGPHI
jgi:hypothetical protein